MKDKVVVVTGASSGIGSAVADLISAKGGSVVLVARREDALHRIVSRCGPLAVGVVADMTARADVRHVVDQALARYAHIDVWINNVGRGITRPPSQLTDEDVDEMMLVNVKSALYGMQEVLPHFQSRNSGHIINVSSMLGRIPFAVMRSAYTGAKHYLNALTANFRMEIQATHPGIQFSLVSPGVVSTDFGLNARHGGPDSRSLPDAQTAEQVAEVVVDVISSRRPDVYSRPGSRERVIAYYSTIAEDP